MKASLSVLLLNAFLCLPAAAQQQATASDPTTVVQAQMDAFNAHDVEAFLSTFAPDVKVYKFPDSLVNEGVDSLRAVYEAAFANHPDVHAALTHRIVQGSIVIDHESVTGMTTHDKAQSTIAIYEVRDGRIATFWFIQYVHPRYPPSPPL